MTNMATYNAASLVSTGESGTVRDTVTAGVIGAGAVKLNSTLQTLANGDKIAERVWQTNVAFGKFVANRVNHAIDAHNRELEAALDF